MTRRETFVRPTEAEIRVAVQKRIAEWEAASESHRDVLSLAGSWKYGLPDSPEDEQVARAIYFYDNTIAYCCCCGGYVHNGYPSDQPTCGKHWYCDLCIGRGHEEDHDCAKYDE